MAVVSVSMNKAAQQKKKAAALTDWTRLKTSSIELPESRYARRAVVTASFTMNANRRRLIADEAVMFIP
jgi:hypothetical protein